MRAQFDPTKAASNLKKQGVSFAGAEGVFADPPAAHRTDPNSEGEERFIALDLGNAGQVLVVSYTLRGNEIRPISARRATRREVKAYAS
jgi:uncharacterized DUF497 family protein